MKSNLVIIKSYCRSSLQMKLFNSLLKSFANEDPHIDYLESKIDSNQDRVNDIKDQINEENQYINELKNKLIDASIELSESKQDLTNYKRNLKSNTIMNTELRKSFVELKKVCKTANQRKAYNKLVKSFSNKDQNREIFNADHNRIKGTFAAKFTDDDAKAIAAALKTLLYDNVNYSLELRTHRIKPTLKEEEIFNLANGIINSNILDLK